MLLDIYLPSPVVIAAHLFRRANMNIVKDILGFEKIDDWKNGLLLFLPLEKAFDNFDLGFVYSPTHDSYRLQLFNMTAEFRETPIIQYVPQSRRESCLGLDLSSPPPDNILRFQSSLDTFDLRTTFADLEGRLIAFKDLNQPYRRCLNLQARIAYILASGKEVPGTVDVPGFDDFWSGGLQPDDIIQRYFDSMAAESLSNTDQAFSDI
jgi:hypothetical protein